MRRLGVNDTNMTTLKRFWQIVFITAISLAASGSNLGNRVAQASPLANRSVTAASGAASGADVVFLLETTSRSYDAAADPNAGNRIRSIQYAAQMLADDAFYHNPGAINTLSVVTFSSNNSVLYDGHS